MKEVPCPISASECVYHACMSDHCQKRHCYDQLKGRYGDGVCQEKPEARIHAFHSTHKDITYCGKSNQDIMVTPENLLNSTSDKRCKTCVRLVKMFRKRKVLKMVVATMLVVSVVSCVKDEEQAITSGIEGTYEGTSILDCPGFGYYKERKNTIEITVSDAERISISSMRTNAKAILNQNRYQYIEFYWIGTSDCGRDMYVVYSQGSGQFKGDSLIENGQAQVNGFPATWKTRSIKIKQ